MAQCEARTKADRRCHNSARNGGRFCSVHAGSVDKKTAAYTAGGVVAGNILAPGIGGMLVGGLAGYLASTLLQEKTRMKKRVFVSFDFDNDRALKDLIIGQSRLADSPFEVIDHSLKEAAPERNWEAKARTAIARSEIVLVMVGANTHRAPGVLKEVQMARALSKRLVQIIGYRDRKYTAVPDAGRLYQWNWENMKELLS